MKLIRPRHRVALLIVAVGLLFLPPLPTRSQEPPSVQRLESDDPRVIQVGTWSSQTTPAASNGSYLYSSGAEADVLALAFVGSAIEIIYVSGPQFGTLAVEIDGTVVRTVISTAEKIEYGLATKVDYLSDEPHSLKVYAQSGGIIAVDAFHISPHLYSVAGEVNSAQSDDGGIQSSTCAPINVLHRVNLTTAGLQAPSGGSSGSVLSSDGRYVAFQSQAVLVGGDVNGVADIFVYDRQTCAITLVSVSSSGAETNNGSSQASISADGRYVAFYSDANNLVAGDTNAASDIFVHDRQTATTTRVSVGSGGVQGTGGSSFTPSISADGRYVGFQSSKTNLVAGDTNAATDGFVHDRQTNTTTRVSVTTGGAQATGPSTDVVLSADGRYAVFDSDATNLVAGDTNGQFDVFVHDRNTTTTTRVSVTTGGAQGAGGGSYTPTISANGRYVGFQSDATNLVTGDTHGFTDIFVHDRQTATTTRVSVVTGGAQGNEGSFDVALSGDGRYVGFESNATNLVTGDTNNEADIFVHDRQTTTTTRASVNTGGSSPDDSSSDAVFSADGRYLAFWSSATTLVNGDTNGTSDVFVTTRAQPSSDNLALFQPTYKGVLLLDTLADNPPAESLTYFSAYAPVLGGQWIMGDWNGDGLKTPGVYLSGAFHYTNDAHETKTWQSLWIGVNGPVVAGTFDVNHDCVGAVDSASFPPFGTAFVLYITCDLSGTPAPGLSSQWLSILLPDSGGFSGTHQFVMGDWNGDGAETIAVRRGTSITWTNDNPFTASAGFANAQYFGAPGVGSEGQLVDGDWDRNGLDSFGLFYQNGEFFYRNDLLFNSGAYANQSVGTPFGGTGVQATTWR